TGWAGFAESYNSPRRFKQLVRLAAKHNLRVNSLVRDSLEPVLRIFEEVNREIPIKDRRWTLVHVLQTTPDQRRRIRDLGLLVETIPLTEMWLRGSRWLDDPELAESAAAHQTFRAEGVDFGFGTDNKPYNPFASLWAAVARRERHTDRVLGPSQCLSRLQALRVFTLGGARFSFDETRLGSVEPGKLADLAVLSEDFLEIPEQDIPNLRSLLTVVGGEVVHRSGEI
ncbi:MAG: amidohydrolase family protein, partial [Dehalococcoidia bacterium]